MQLARNKILYKPSRRGQYLTPIKSNTNSNLKIDNRILYIAVNKCEIIHMKTKNAKNNQFGVQLNTHKVAISQSEFENPILSIFKQFEHKQQPNRQIDQLITNEEGHKQILDIFSQRAKTQQLKQVSKQSMVRRLSHQNDSDNNKQIQSAYNQLDSLIKNRASFYDKQKLSDIIYGKVEKTLGAKFSIVIEDSLKRLVKKMSTKEEVKNYICNKLLIADLTLIRLYHQIQKQLGGGMRNPFKTMNHINKQIFTYLKSKYPRAKNLFVPFQINQRFQEINFLSLSQNNIILNAGFTFTQPNATRLQIITKTKQFLNTLLAQVDKHYPKFTKLLNQQAFVIINQDKRRNKTKIKIGRKLPDDTQKFYHLQSDNLQITSPQVFRVMIKWIQEMQLFLTEPSTVISKRKGIKSVKFDDQGKPYFQQVRSKRLQQIKVDLIEKISQNKQFGQKMAALLEQLDQFNNSLTKTLITRQCQNAFIKQQDAECLKFAKFNTQFLEWLIVEKFLIIIEILSKISQEFQHKFFKKLDFINFNVYDLMRASFQGKKQQIFAVFENLKKIERQGKISIVRLKNRFSSSLNDVLINFKLKQSFLICELQLILSDDMQDGQDKLKSMEEINHIIYQLQRSPFGPLSQMAISMGYHDPTINYQQKIAFKTDWFKQQICVDGQVHDFIEIYDQKTPFVCSWCVKFYGRLQNFFERHQCKKCILQKCKACVFEADRDEQRKTFRKYFLSAFQGIPIQEVQSQDEDFITNFFQNKISFLDEQYTRVRDHIDMSTKSKLQNIQKFLYRKQIEYNLRGSQALYGIILHFANGKCSLEVVKYSNYQVELCGRLQQYSLTFRLQQYDVIFFLKQKVYNANTKSQMLFKVQSSELKLQLYDLTKTAIVKIVNPNSQVVYIKGEKQKYLLDIIKSSFSTNKAQAQQTIKSVTSRLINRCETYPLSRKQITLQNIGINTQHLIMFKNKIWSKDVLVLNLSYNRIIQIDNTLDGFDSLEELYLSHNQLRDLNLKQQKNTTLLILDVSFNQLKEVPQSINNYSELNVLNLKYNRIQKIPNLILPKLQQLDMDKNQVKNFQVLLESNLKSLLILDMSFNKQEDAEWILKLSLNKLKCLETRSMKIVMDGSKLNLNNFIQVQRIDLSDNKFSSFEPIECSNLRQIKILRNGIKNIEGIFTNKLLFLSSINLHGNQIQTFPYLDLDSLKQINICSNNLKDISNIKKCILHQLQMLNLQYNQLTQIQQLTYADLPQIREILLNNNKITRLPKLSFPQLQVLDLKQNKITDISQISQANLPKISKISFKDNLINTVPQFNLKQLKELSLSKNKIKDFSSLKQVLGIKSLVLWKNDLQTFPQIKSSSLQMIYLYQNKIKDISNLATSKIEHVKIISLFSNEIEKIPVLDFPQLEKVHIQKNKINDISNLSKWKTPSLKLLQLNFNNITVIPKMNFRQLNTLQIYMNKLQDISQLSNSQLNALKNLILKQNNITKVPALNFKNIQTINLQKNKINDIQTFILHSNLPNLRQLILNKNQIQEFPEDFRFSLIETLHLKQNKLKKFHVKNPQLLKYLEKIFLTDNKLEFFNFAILQYSTLVYQVSLTKNPIKSWGFSEFSKIRKLFLVSCQLKQLNSLYLPHLEDLNLSRNELESINFIKQPGSMVSLNRLSLEYNKLRTLPMIELSKLSDIALVGNPLEDLKLFLKSSLPKLKSISLSKAEEVELAISKNTGLQQNKDIQVILQNLQIIEQAALTNFDAQTDIQLHEAIQPKQSEQKKHLKRKLSLINVDTRKQLVAQLKAAFPKVRVYPNI